MCLQDSINLKQPKTGTVFISVVKHFLPFLSRRKNIYRLTLNVENTNLEKNFIQASYKSLEILQWQTILTFISRIANGNAIIIVVCPFIV